MSVLALIRPESSEAFALDAAQTPPGLAKAEASDYSRIDFYLEQVTDCLRRAPERLNSPHFKRDVRVVLLVDATSDSYVVLASTDCSQPARQVVHFYRLRFQIKLLFRDAKHFAGLCHCQARSQEKLDLHFNMSLAAINVARLEIGPDHEELSRNSYVRRAYNR